MSNQPFELYAMLRRALASQVEMGVGELIVAPHIATRLPSVAQVQAALAPRVVTAADAFAAESGALQPVGMVSNILAQPEFESLESHREAICNCQKCPLGKTRNKFVYGVGNPKADLMFVGEAPGADEDRLGEPFVGRAGQLLDKILAAMGLDRSKIYIANVLKCRPPGNRDPLPEEVELCIGYLKEQVRSIRPKLMVALGRIAAQALLDTKSPLGKLRGSWHEFETIPLLVTYHPAALLRFAQYKRDTWADMQIVMARLKELS
jgi:DNA polymerase